MTELLADSRHTAPDHAVDLLTRFQQAVAATPDRIAVSHHGALTFAELDRYTARLAGVLAYHGAAPGRMDRDQPAPGHRPRRRAAGRLADRRRLRTARPRLSAGTPARDGA